MEHSKLWDYMEKNKEEYYRRMHDEQEKRLQFIRNRPSIFLLSGPNESDMHAVVTELLKSNTGLIYVPLIQGQYSGTDTTLYAQAIEKHQIIINDIDVNGAMAFKKHFQNKTRLFYLRVSEDIAFEENLRSRGDTEGDIQKRYANKLIDDSKIDLFDYVIDHTDLGETVRQITEIITSETTLK